MPEIFLRFPEGKKKALTLSYDDGVEQDTRLIEIMIQNGLKGTFNLNSGLYTPEGTVYQEGTIHRRMSKAQATRLYADSGMEVALHAYEHPHLEGMTPEACAFQIVKDKEMIEEQFGRIVRGMAYPYGTFSDSVVDTAKLCGVAYARTVESTHRFSLPKDWLRMPATCRHADPMLMELAHSFLEEDTLVPALFYLWGHSYEFESHNNWQVIEEFAALMGGRGDVWYATNIEILDYVEAYRAMISSADGHRWYNPSALTVYFAVGSGNVQCVPGGGCVTI